MAKMKGPWIALCSAAIGAIYTVGYITTDNHVSAQPVSQIQTAKQTQNNAQPVSQIQTAKQTQNNAQPVLQIQTGKQTQNNAQPVSQIQTGKQTQDNAQPVSQIQTGKQTQFKSLPVTSDQVRPQAHVNTHVSNVQAKRMYKDGTYTGSGSNRRGSIAVNVTIKNDKIKDVTISDFGMHYSESDIEGLPSEVVQKQRAKTINVSGATYSTEAFQDAVQDALTQARNT